MSESILGRRLVRRALEAMGEGGYLAESVIRRFEELCRSAGGSLNWGAAPHRGRIVLRCLLPKAKASVSMSSLGSVAKLVIQLNPEELPLPPTSTEIEIPSLAKLDLYTPSPSYIDLMKREGISLRFSKEGATKLVLDIERGAKGRGIYMSLRLE